MTTAQTTPAQAAPRLSATPLAQVAVLERDMAVLTSLVNSNHRAGKPTTLDDVLGTLLAMLVIRQLRHQGLSVLRAAPRLAESEFWQAMVGLGGELAHHATDQMQHRLQEIEALAGTDPHDIARALIAHWNTREEASA